MNLLSISISKICIDLDFLLKTKLNGSPMCCVCHYCSFLNCLQKLNLQDCYDQIYLFKKENGCRSDSMAPYKRFRTNNRRKKNVQIVTLGANNALAIPLKINVTLPSFDYLPLDFSNPRRVFNPPF